MLLSILYLILAILPVLIYIGIIWATLPVGSITIRNSYLHFISGLVSVGLVLTYLRIFPNAHENISFNINVSLFVLAFLQIAVIEEITKFVSFKMGEMLRGDENIIYDIPVSTMFYSGISALGFSFIENVTYAIQYGGEILIPRSFISMLLHFLCGLIMGYWVALSRIPTKVKNKSPFELVIMNRPIIKKVTYLLLGIFSAVFVHGLFDYNLMTKGHITSNYLIILSGVIASYLAAKDLNEKTKFN